MRIKVISAYLALLIGALSVVDLQSVFAQNGAVRIYSVADITGDNASHRLQTSGSARWVQIIATSTNGAACRIGDSAVSSSEGLAIAAGAGFMFPPVASDSRESTQQHFYDLSSIYYLCGTGDKLQVIWGR